MMPCILTTGEPVIGRACHCGRCYRSELAGPIDVKAVELMLRSFQITNQCSPAFATITERTYTAVWDEAVEAATRRGVTVPGCGPTWIHGCLLRVVPGDDDFFLPQAARDPLIFGASV